MNKWASLSGIGKVLNSNNNKNKTKLQNEIIQEMTKVIQGKATMKQEQGKIKQNRNSNHKQIGCSQKW